MCIYIKIYTCCIVRMYIPDASKTPFCHGVKDESNSLWDDAMYIYIYIYTYIYIYIYGNVPKKGVIGNMHGRAPGKGAQDF